MTSLNTAFAGCYNIRLKKIFILCTLLLLCAGFSFSQNQAEGSLVGSSSFGRSFRVELMGNGQQIVFQKLVWESGGQGGSYEVHIEEFDAKDGFGEIFNEPTDNNSIEIGLDRGRYRYRVSFYNKAKQFQNMTDWYYFNILPAVKPKIRGLTPQGFKLKKGAEYTIALTGENFLPETEVFLKPRAKGSDIRPVSSAVSPTAIRIVFDPNDLAPGDYELYVQNADTFEDHVNFAVKGIPGVKEFTDINGYFFGLGPEVNGHTRSGTAVGGLVYLGMEHGQCYSTGIKTGFFNDMKTVTSLEPVVFFRYYILKEASGLYAQAEAGGVIYLENGKTYPAFSGGLSAGWRFGFEKNWFLEPYFRAGYPYSWGLGVMAGLRLDAD